MIRIGSSRVQSLSIVVVLTFGGLATAASAQTVGDETKCRKAASKNATKLAATVGKNQRRCVKDVLKGSLTLAMGEKCHQNAVSDVAGKAAKVEQKLREQIGGSGDRCPNGSGEHAITLAGYQPECPVGKSFEPFSIDDFEDVAECLVRSAVGGSELAFGEILNPDYVAIAASPELKNLKKCSDAIAKDGIKLMATVRKERARAQDGIEKNSSDVAAAYGQYGVANSKIDSAIGKLNASIDKRCVDASKSPMEADLLRLLGSCASTIAGIKSCVAKAAQDTSEGQVNLVYVSPGEFPASATIVINAGSSATVGWTTGGGAPAGRQSRTQLDVGFNGLGHRVDVPDGFATEVSLNCSDEGVCAISASCGAGNCRCESPNNDVVCDEPFGPDADDCGGADCELFFGPPVAMNSGRTPVCVQNVIQSLSGLLDLSDGRSFTNLENAARVHSSESGQSQPCSICINDPTPNDGSKGGTCIGGPDNGNACDQNALHPTFGPSSYDCDLDPAKNVSGSGLTTPMRLSDNPTPLTASVPCVGLPGTLDCHCLQCSGDSTIACSADADCISAFAGTCTSSTGVSLVLPNLCGAFVCGAGAPEECDDATTTFCDGFLRASGDGMLDCSSNADCDGLSSSCTGGDCGTCTLEQNLPCFEDTIDAARLTNAGTDHAVLATNFCVSPTASAGINAATGMPGPGRLRLSMAVDLLCDDGTTEWVYGGASCP